MKVQTTIGEPLPWADIPLPATNLNRSRLILFMKSTFLLHMNLLSLPPDHSFSISGFHLTTMLVFRASHALLDQSLNVWLA